MGVCNMNLDSVNLVHFKERASSAPKSLRFFPGGKSSLHRAQIGWDFSPMKLLQMPDARPSSLRGGIFAETTGPPEAPDAVLFGGSSPVLANRANLLSSF